MRRQGLFRRSTRAGPCALLLSLTMASCATPGGLREVRISEVHALGWTNSPGLGGTIDFERRRFVADIRGEHYVGDIPPFPTLRSMIFEPRSASGATMECSLDQLQEQLWVGKCTDSQQRVFRLEVGRTFHV